MSYSLYGSECEKQYCYDFRDVSHNVQVELMFCKILTKHGQADKIGKVEI